MTKARKTTDFFSLYRLIINDYEMIVKLELFLPSFPAFINGKTWKRESIVEFRIELNKVIEEE